MPTPAAPSLLESPILLTPEPAARVWGGRQIADLFRRTLPEGEIGESWEVHGELKVSQGPLQGRTLDSLVQEFGERLLGRRGDPAQSFPLLSKWLDCRDWLSVQVHPDDKLARELTGSESERGKSEAWYVARREEGAELIHGLAKGVSPQQLVGVEDASILELLGKSSPAEGALLFTGAGTVHALGPGFLIYEIQQSSDLTYRLYDWGRDRPVHIEESGRCLTEAVSPSFQQDESGLRCSYFEIETIQGQHEIELVGESFLIVAAVEGSWTLEGPFGTVHLRFGDTALLPAQLGKIRLLPADGTSKLLKAGLGVAHSEEG